MNIIKNNKVLIYTSFATLAFMACSSFANAQSNQGMPHNMPGMQMQPGQNGGPPQQGGQYQGQYQNQGMGNYGSSTRSMGMQRGMNGSSTGMYGMHMVGSSTMQMTDGTMMNRGIIGTVTDVESTYLTIEGQNLQNASTSYTVDFAASTTYSNGSTTASLSDISIGNTIVVNGPLATSTKTITAYHISIGTPMGMGGRFNNNSQNQSSGTSMGMGTNFPPQNASTTPPVQSHSFIGKVFHKLFGWL